MGRCQEITKMEHVLAPYTLECFKATLDVTLSDYQNHSKIIK